MKNNKVKIIFKDKKVYNENYPMYTSKRFKRLFTDIYIIDESSITPYINITHLNTFIYKIKKPIYKLSINARSIPTKSLINATFYEIDRKYLVNFIKMATSLKNYELGIKLLAKKCGYDGEIITSEKKEFRN